MTENNTHQITITELLKSIRNYDTVNTDTLAKLFVILRTELGRIERTRGHIAEQNKYTRTGECNQCGWCCNPLTLYGMSDDPYKGRCTNLRTKWRKGKRTFYCMIYKNRPIFCRNFPDSPSDTTYIPCCGYKFKETKP